MAISLDRCEELIVEFCERYPSAASLVFKIGNTPKELYGNGISEDINQRAIGSYHPRDGVIKLAAANFLDDADCLRTIQHEVLGHYATNTFTEQNKREILEAIIASRDVPSMQSSWQHVDKYYKDAPELRKAEEVYCLSAEAIGLRPAAPRQDFVKAWSAVISTNTRPLELNDLNIIVDTVAQGIREGVREQKIFPKTNDAQFQFNQEGSMEKEEQTKQVSDLTADERARFGLDDPTRPDISEAVFEAQNRSRMTYTDEQLVERIQARVQEHIAARDARNVDPPNFQAMRDHYAGLAPDRATLISSDAIDFQQIKNIDHQRLAAEILVGNYESFKGYGRDLAALNPSLHARTMLMLNEREAGLVVGSKMMPEDRLCHIECRAEFTQNDPHTLREKALMDMAELKMLRQHPTLERFASSVINSNMAAPDYKAAITDPKTLDRIEQFVAVNHAMSSAHELKNLHWTGKPLSSGDLEWVKQTYEGAAKFAQLDPGATERIKERALRAGLNEGKVSPANTPPIEWKNSPDLQAIWESGKSLSAAEKNFQNRAEPIKTEQDPQLHAHVSLGKDFNKSVVSSPAFAQMLAITTREIKTPYEQGKALRELSRAKDVQPTLAKSAGMRM